MKSNAGLSNALAVGLIAGLAACGGGGGGGGPAPVVPTIDISALNRDAVAHAAAASILVLSPTGAIPLAPSASVSALLTRGSQPLRKWAAGARTERRPPQAVIGPFVHSCVLSGTWSETDDDRDGNNAPSVGDVITLGFSACQDTPAETLNGSMVMTLTRLDAGALGARVALAQMSTVTANHSMTIDGSMQFNLTASSASMTADGPVTAEVVISHLGYSDLLTLQSGCFVQDTILSSPALVQTRVNGHLHSRNAGGIVEVSTLANAPIAKLDADAYPSTGTIQVKGKNSTLRATALSASLVRLDLDADGNGSFEATDTVNWDWLL